MANPVDYAISHARLTIATLLFLLIAGFSAYVSIPKESEPDVRVPIIYVNVTQRGISPEDAERLILRPMETQLKSVANIKEMRSAAYEGGGYVLVEFEAGFDSAKALADVRAKVDDAKSDLPRDADEPKVQEVNLSLFPVLVVTLGGDVPERTLLRLARQSETAIEQVPGVLSADLRGARDEAVEIIAEPMLMKSYGISLDQLVNSFAAGNSLVAAGALESASGRFAVKVPSLIERPEDVLKFPVAATGAAAVTLGDVAEVRPTFKDATSITRINGKPAIAIEVVKRTGANLIETVDNVKKVVGELQRTWPATVRVTFTQDKSKDIRSMLHELQNSVITAVLLVIVIMLVVLGARASIFIGIAIPASFLAGILGLQLAGLTVNIVVLFSLILAVGMLVDDAIIVSEFAERRMSEGMPAPQAYSLAAKRMAGPVIAATATRVAAFSPLMFWPGIVGEFMKYMPLTLIATLSASLIVALFFTPTLGAMLGRASHVQDERMAERGPYMRTVRLALKHPFATLGLSVLLLVGVIQAYGRLGNGVEFFPDVEPEFALVQVRARGNLSIAEKDRLVRQVEERLLGMKELETIYARSGEGQRGSTEVTEDTIGTIQFEFVDWRERRKSSVIMDEIRAKTQDIPGVIIEVTKPKAGPPTGKPVTIQIASIDPDLLFPAARKAAALLRARSDTRDVDDGLPLPGIDWRIDVDKAEAAKYGASPLTVGTGVQLVTNGVKVAEYRPNDTDKAVDILLRFPENRRSLDQLDELRINTAAGAVPISNFMARQPEQKVGLINRVAGRRVVTVTANVAEGVQTAAVQHAVMQELAKADLGPGVTFKLKGEDEEREKAGAFLMKAFGAAIFLIFAILLAQFNKFTSVFLVLSAVVLSTIGVLIGLMLMGQAFGVVMTGIGVIANAGVIVNNNIVLIDTYDRLRHEGWSAYDAIVETCRERARPVVLTAVTAVLGVLAIAFGINIDFVTRAVDIGAPSTQWWVHLSTAIVFGLGFATVLTLIVTPAALMALARMAEWRETRKLRRRERKAAESPAGAAAE
ncbi:efflux RND transporter permease subunit [Chelatococcus sp. SYSU_G07232]|uniref:Efflux RND transporter permease subunit n=1 Tax=Chelatococcus albus TaxID=3047466 RepID=A0ABT7ALE6_9HYPH|nr:efflux RND transporter permease subunit [Chelatococcus sp. SYSU_G07232]MDJ1160200.1 efflux RND transporter permease subunit [Chelatococcus sp. SYSU_G07232]